MAGALWVGLLAVALMGAGPAAAESRLFTDEAPLQIAISAPFPALVRAAPTSIAPYPATLSVSDGAGPAQSFAIQLRARGKTRRTAGYCKFPPLLLTFDKASVHGTLFKGQHKLKLVTYCRPEADYEQRIVLEYLAYRLYNLVTPMSHRVRAAQVTYRTGPADTGLTRFGFLIEGVDDVADRNQREELKAASHQIAASQLDARAAARAALFEFMIANLDWEFLAGPAGVNCCHNSHFIAAADATPAAASEVAPLPYDFDYSGFVDAPYSGPPVGIPTNKVTDRYYRGYCTSTREVPAVVEEFRGHRAEMMAMINGEPRLNPEFRAKTVRFMEGFFAVLDDPARVQRQIVGHCR